MLMKLPMKTLGILGKEIYINYKPNLYIIEGNIWISTKDRKCGNWLINEIENIAGSEARRG